MKNSNSPEKAANCYAEDCREPDNCILDQYEAFDARECAFMAGIRWKEEQNPWRKYEDQKPIFGKACLCKSLNVKGKTSYVCLKRHCDKQKQEHWIELFHNTEFTSSILEWKYIN